MKKIFNSRFLSLVILLFVVCAIFSSCTPATQTITISDVKVSEVKELSQTQLKTIADFLNNETEAKDEFIAASLDESGIYIGSVHSAKQILVKYDNDSTLTYDLLSDVDVEMIANFLKNNTEIVRPNPLTQSQLNDIATLIRNDTSAWSDFVAAYRGYDVLGDHANLSEYPGVLDENGNYVVNVDAAKKVISKYDKTGSLTYGSLTADDVKNIVDAMKVDISFEENRDIFSTLKFWIGSFLGFITNTIGFGNYLVGICIFAILVELCMIPLTIKQQKNSIKQASLRPKEMAIRNRYKGRNDQATQQKVTQEIQDLYQREDFNPMAGCGPMLLQLPIIMILYSIVVDPIQYVVGGTSSFVNAIRIFSTASKAAGGLGMSFSSQNGTIELLSQIGKADISALQSFELVNNSEAFFENLGSMLKNIPSFNIGPINFGLTPSLTGNYWLLVVPVLTFVVYFYSMKISKKFTYQPTQNENAPGQGCSNKMMEFYMPVISTFFCFNVPGAVGIYWVFRSVVGTFKQFIMSKVMPTPVFTEEDYKAAERELNSNRPQRKRKKENSEDLDPDRERPRSLHHIDDDDEDYPTFVK